MLGILLAKRGKWKLIWLLLSLSILLLGAGLALFFTS